MIEVTLLSYNIITTFDNTNHNMHTVPKKQKQKTNCEKICDPKSIQKKKTNKLMVGYKILSFLDVIEILITTRRKANEVANIHKNK